MSTVWSRIIHAWPSFALIGAYELLMRHFRANAVGVRTAHAVRMQAGDGASSADHVADSAPESGKAAGGQERPGLRVVQARKASSTAEVVETVAPEMAPPKIQCDAWAWALAHRREDGSLPTGQELAERFGRKPR